MSFLKSLWSSSEDLKEDEAKAKAKNQPERSSELETDPDKVQDMPNKPPEEGSLGSVLWSILSSKMGGDVMASGISLPAYMYEPLTILQRTCECIENNYLLDDASKEKDSLDRLAYVGAFAVSAYSGTSNLRTKTNFNPILGETFEFVDERNNTRYFGEQNSQTTTKFMGNSLDIDTHGRSHIYFPDTGDHFYFTNPCTRVHNIIVGSMWTEHYGDISIENVRTKEKLTITLKKAGIFQGTQFGITAYVLDASGKKKIKLSGKWNDALHLEWLSKSPQHEAKSKLTVFKVQPETRVEPYFLNKFTESLYQFTPEMKELLLPSDSRRRLDRIFLSKGNAEVATQWKRKIESKQRQDRKERTSPWKPVWFVKIQGNESKEQIQQLLKGPESGKEYSAIEWDHTTPNFKGMWVYVGDYWKQRRQKKKLLCEGKTLAAEQLLCPDSIADTACDFLHYTRKRRNSSTNTALTASAEKSDLSESLNTDEEPPKAQKKK